MVYSDLHICAGPVLPCHMRPDECSVMHAARQVTSSCTLARLVSSDWSLQGSWSPGACVHEQGCWCGKCASHRSLCAPQRGRLSQAMPVQHTPRSLVLEQHPERYLHMRPTCHPQPARLTKKGAERSSSSRSKKQLTALSSLFRSSQAYNLAHASKRLGNSAVGGGAPPHDRLSGCRTCVSLMGTGTHDHVLHVQVFDTDTASGEAEGQARGCRIHPDETDAMVGSDRLRHLLLCTLTGP